MNFFVLCSKCMKEYILESRELLFCVFIMCESVDSCFFPTFFSFPLPLLALHPSSGLIFTAPNSSEYVSIYACLYERISQP